MATLNPDHLFEQAERLIAAPQAGPPRQVDLRRAISAAYYGVFHFVLTALADEFVGSGRRGTSLYELVYRSVDHSALRALCEEMSKSSPRPKYLPHLPGSGMGANIQAFAQIATDLQQKRNRADYDPTPRFRTVDAQLAVDAARRAIQRFETADAARRKTFLTLLLCPPR